MNFSFKPAVFDARQYKANIKASLQKGQISREEIQYRAGELAIRAKDISVAPDAREEARQKAFCINEVLAGDMWGEEPGFFKKTGDGSEGPMR